MGPANASTRSERSIFIRKETTWHKVVFVTNGMLIQRIGFLGKSNIGHADDDEPNKEFTSGLSLGTY